MTEITRQHLEDAALAAGLSVAAGYVAAHDDLTAIALGSGMEWRPHLDDGDAFRLAVAAEVVMHSHDTLCSAWPSGRRGRGADISTTRHNGTPSDAARAAREAVVLGAAKVGRRMRAGNDW